MKYLLELLEQHFTLVCAVTATPGAYDLYFWKYDRVEVGALLIARLKRPRPDKGAPRRVDPR